MRGWKLAAIAAFVLLMSGCGGGKGRSSVTVSVSPPVAAVVLGGSAQFTAAVLGSSNTNVNWSLSGTGCSGSGNPCGTITSTGLYMAPTTLPSSTTVTVTATSQAASSASASATVTLDSGIRVSLSPGSATMGTSENLTLTPTVTGTTNIGVNWTVNTVANGNSTVGQICVTLNPCVAPSAPTTSMVFYLAPATVPASLIVVQATSSVDTSRFGAAGISVLAAAPPVLLSLSPSTATQGSVFQDVYLTGNAFFTTSTVLANTVALPAVTTTFLSQTLLRVRIFSCISGSPSPPPGCPGNLLQNAGSITLAVQNQSGARSSSLSLTVTTTRPAIVSAAPDSVPQCVSGPCSGASVLLTGGHFSPSSAATFNGLGVTDSQVTANQLNVAIPGTALGAAGLFPLALNNGEGTPISAVNLAVEPSVTANPPSVLATVSVGMQPSAVAVNTATGRAVVTNRADNTVSVIDLSSNLVSCPLPVGRTPTGVAIDNLRNLSLPDRALVVNQGDNTLSLLDLSTATFPPCGAPPAAPPTVALPTGFTPVSVGVNPLTHHALVANQLTNQSTVIDLTRNPPVVAGMANISTGPNPAVAIVPRLDWAVVTPGGAGTTSIVDLTHNQIPVGSTTPAFVVVATLNISTTIQGIGINPETGSALLTDPSGSGAATFSFFDQTVSLVQARVGTNNVAAAVNPLTNVGLAVNNRLNQVTLIDLGTPVVLGSPISVGNNPVAVAIDPVTDEALVANQNGNSVSILSLGTIRPLHVVQVSPATTFTSTTDLPITVIGNGFVSGSVVRLDQTPLSSATTTLVSARQLTAMVPRAMLGAAHRFIVDVLNPNGTVSNVTDLAVIQPVAVGTAPGAVAVGNVVISGAPHDVAVVTNTGSSNISVVDLGTGTVMSTLRVGTSPQGVDVISRLGRAVVANNGDNNVSLADLVGGTVTATVAVGQQPIGVAINGDTASAAVSNSASNALSLLAADTGQPQAIVAVDQRPVALAIDPVTNLAAVANATQNTVDIVNLTSLLIQGRPSSVNFQVPNGVALDPVSGNFVVANSLLNVLDIVDPNSLLVTPVRVGINPTSIAYNFQTATLVTVNGASHTASVVDFLGRRVRAILSVDGSPQQSVAINPANNLAVVADQANNRLLLVPLPR